MTEKNKSIIPVLLAVVIGIFILFLAWSAKQASTGGTDITDRDYYSKGLKYNSTLIERRAASVIGWTLTASLEPGHLALALTDKNGVPVVGATGKISVPEPGSNRSNLYSLDEKSPGYYLFILPDDLSGERLTRVNFELDGARISRQLLLNINKAVVIRDE